METFYEIGFKVLEKKMKMRKKFTDRWTTYDQKSSGELKTILNFLKN